MMRGSDYVEIFDRLSAMSDAERQEVFGESGFVDFAKRINRLSNEALRTGRIVKLAPGEPVDPRKLYAELLDRMIRLDTILQKTTFVIRLVVAESEGTLTHHDVPEYPN